MSKAERTIEYILEIVAPIFNKNGYNGTSMSDITKATGLTKGAIYGNFENKEELALEAFNLNIKKVFNRLAEAMDPEEHCLDKLKAMTKFYRNYPALTSDLGGCPLLNVGVDSNNQNELLAKRVSEVNLKLQRNISNLIQGGIDQDQISSSIDSMKMAGRIIAMIEGSVYMTFTLHDHSYMKDMMDHIDRMIETEMTI
ncbi:MAG: TetR/AcrR family transcriptional regulator [Bacteroidetes bacterium]|nr:TetR/AcrR family transcriptional regulator [Bacteroidota bacterium]MDA1122401.1 TetR/AcrR family transcriptional regulator [Bacteroidota bacterium]